MEIILIFSLSCVCVISAVSLIIKSKKIASLQQQIAEHEIRLAVADERVKERDLLNQKWCEQFEQLSAKALRNNNEAFLTQAKSSFSFLTKEASHGFDSAVKPIETVLKAFDEKLKKLEEQRNTSYLSLAEQLKCSNQANEALKTETNNLCNALRRPDVRGQWGEMQLRRTVELAGMTEHVDFEEQENTVTSDGKKLRPDMIIKLPNTRTIVVDAKTPLNSYLDAISSESKADQKSLFDKLASDIKSHIERLSSTEYWKQFSPCPEFVVLFLPGENFLSDAFRANANLLEFGVSKRVILATPTTLIALLKAISYGWKQARLAEEANEIASVGREMYVRLKTFFAHFNKVGEFLSKSVAAFNDMRSSADTRLIPQVRRFQTLGIGSEEIAITEAIEKLPKVQ